MTKLEEKIINLRQSIGISRNETKQALKQLAAKQDITTLSYIGYRQQKLITYEHHRSLIADRDIVLDIAPDLPMQRQVSALRHAFLNAEKEARQVGRDNTSSWQTLGVKLQQIIEFYKQKNPMVGISVWRNR